MNVVCFGDSITQGYCRRFRATINSQLEGNTRVIDAGVPGETSSDGLRRLNKILKENPDIVIIGFGMNDWRKGVERSVFKGNLQSMVERLKERNARVILLTMNPNVNRSDMTDPLLVEFNEAIQEVAYEQKVRMADVFSLWSKELPEVEKGLYDEIHPNRLGNETICKALYQVVPRTQTVIVWAFNGLYAFCNYRCEYCYVPHEENNDHHFRSDLSLDDWARCFEKSFPEEKLVFYLSYGEPMLSAGFYQILDMIASRPRWRGHITSNLSASLLELVETQLVKERRFDVNASFHPTQVHADKFLEKLLFLRKHNIECPVIIVAWPPFLSDLDSYVQFFEKSGFLVHLRRYRGWHSGKHYPESYTDSERRSIAKYCDDATIKYMLNESTIDLRGKLSYEGMYYVLADENGDVWSSPDTKGRYLGNMFQRDVRLYTNPQPYPLRWCGSVNGVASLLETCYTELSGNFVLSFAKQGGVYRTDQGVYHKNLDTDFTDPRIRKEYGFPETELKGSSIRDVLVHAGRTWNSATKDYCSRRIYPILERKRRAALKFLYELTR